MPPFGGLESGNPDGEDDSTKADKLAKRAARFNKQLVGNRHKELEEARTGERKVFEQQGLIRAGKTELGEAVDMRGTCEKMCSEYEAEFREFTGEVHPLEARDGDKRRIDHQKAVAAYTRSDAGAGHGEAAKLPSDLRTPITLVNTLNYLFASILPCQPTAPSPLRPTPRTALGYTAGFIRDRTRAIRKEFAMQSSWGQMEAIESFERIARWHILCLRELQEESGMNTDMHIDSAELGRCFTSLRQHYNDRREETGLDMPCINESEFRAYMLIFDLTQKAVAISTAEIPSVILDHPNVQLAWQIRRAAQRNFDTQKEGSKQNAELGANIITSYVKILRQANVPYLLSCLAEVRLREIRRSALRALKRAYPSLRVDPIRRDANDQIIERRMVLLPTLVKILGCEQQETEESAWDDTERYAPTPEMEAVEIAKKFGFQIHEELGRPVGVFIHLAVHFDDNKDAPYTRRWKLISDKRNNMPYSEIINGKAGVLANPAAFKFAPTSTFRPSAPTAPAGFSFKPTAPTAMAPPKQLPAPAPFSFGAPSNTPMQPVSQYKPPQAGLSSIPATPPLPAPVPAPSASTSTSTSPFTFNLPKAAETGAPPPVPTPAPTASPVEDAPKRTKRVSFDLGANTFASATSFASTSSASTSASTPAPTPFSFTATIPSAPTAITADASVVPKAPTAVRPSFFSTPAVAGPSTPSVAAPLPTAPSTPSHQSPKSRSPRTLLHSPNSATLRTSTLLKSSPLNRSVSRPTPTPDDAAKSRSQRKAIAPLADTLITEIFQSFISDMTDDLHKVVRSQIAAKEHLARKAQRQRTIEHWSPAIFDRMVEEISGEIATGAYLRQSAKRGRARQSVQHWREWTKEREETRDEADKDRKDVSEILKEMGLGEPVDSAREGMIRGDSIFGAGERIEERQLEMGLHEAERLKESFYSPSSFLHTIARQISPILGPYGSENSAPQFQLLLSTAADSASPAPPTASKWLVDKVSPRLSDGNPWWTSEGVRYACEVRSRHGELNPTRLGRLGMVLVEVPMSSALNRERERNTTDVQDRLTAIIDIAKRSMVAYNAPLIILTWQEETLEEISERLDLADCLSRFENVTVMCLSQVNDLDARFANAVQEVVSPAIIREQLFLRLSEMTASIMPAWERLLDSSTLLLKNHPFDPALALSTFRAGIDSLNEVAFAVRAWLKRAHVDQEEDFDPVILPQFEVSAVDGIPAAVTSVEVYLDSNTFAGLQDIQLSGSNLNSASTRNEPLPISSILNAIAAFTLGELSHQHLPLELYGTPSYIHSLHSDFINNVTSSYQHSVEGAIASLASLAPTSQILSPGSASGKISGRKRPAGGDISPPALSRESKSAKNSRLLMAIRDVERTIEGSPGGGDKGGGGGAEIWV